MSHLPRRYISSRTGTSILLVGIAMFAASAQVRAVSWEWGAMNTTVKKWPPEVWTTGSSSGNYVTSFANAPKSSGMPYSAATVPGDGMTASVKDQMAKTAVGSADTNSAEIPNTAVSQLGRRGPRVAPWAYGLGAKGTWKDSLFVEELSLSLEWIIILVLIGILTVILIGLSIFCCMMRRDNEGDGDEDETNVKLPQPKTATRRSSQTSVSASKKLNTLITTTVSSRDGPRKQL